MTSYDIRAAIRTMIDETDLTAPEDIAARVVQEVPEDQLRAVLAMVLREYIRVELGRQRMAPQPGPTPAPTRSAKVSAIRAAGPKWLRDRVFVGNSTWLMLGECGYEQLRYLESERRTNAARSVAAADRYARLAELVETYNVPRVADLPVEVLNNEGEEAA